MFQKIEGIVIRTIDYGETNKIVILLTRELGKISVMARGAKKTSSRLTSVTQLFTYGYFLIQIGKGMGTLQQGEVISSMKELRQDIFLTAYSSLVVELTDKAVEEKKNNPYLFELLLQTLQHMEEGADAEILMLIYELKLLPVVGVKPSLDQCASCGSTSDFVAFSFGEGGFLCQRCLHKDKHSYKMSETAMKLMRFFFHIDVARLGQISVKEENRKQIRYVIDTLYDDYVGMYLKTKRFLKQLDLFKINE